MRNSGLLMGLALLAGCASPLPKDISCQPHGYSPEPIAFSFALGPVTESAAEQTAVALFESCGSLDPTRAITNLTSSVSAATGDRAGPNAGHAVWLVRIDATVAEPSPGAIYPSHFLIEVSQETGFPTIIGYG